MVKIKRHGKRYIIWILVVSIMLASALYACDKKENNAESAAGTSSASGETAAGNQPGSPGAPEPSAAEEEASSVPEIPDDAPNPVVTITMESGAEIVIELLRDKAPNTVDNFISLVQSGFYDGLNFHRVSEGFMIQGGCPLGTGTGNPGYSIKGEFSENGFTENDLSHMPGVISMARSDNPDSAGCQFFICAGDASFLDGKYAAFGKTVSGLKEVFNIAKLNANDGPPSTPQIMKSVTVDTFGVEYPKPETLQR